MTVAQLDQALAVAPVAAVQNRLSYSDPGDLPTALACAERDVAYLAYSPFGGPTGLIPQAARVVAGRRGVSAHRVLLAWLRHQAPNMVPLAGASRPASIRDSAARLDLADSDLETLCVWDRRPRLRPWMRCLGRPAWTVLGWRGCGQAVSLAARTRSNAGPAWYRPTAAAQPAARRMSGIEANPAGRGGPAGRGDIRSVGKRTGSSAGFAVIGAILSARTDREE
ncbi:MAG TPA: hypothetical protein VFQ68_12485 [Streptosporangiaceae bacterium]|nr:hypothetical protein [Streptosporangiaceae bacterium]